MGVRSGYTGDKGRRVRAPPQLFPLKPPTASDLGLPSPPFDDVSSWPLHVKHVQVIDWDVLQRFAADSPLERRVRLARSWLTSPTDYGVDWAPLAPAHIPLSRFTPEQVQTMVEYGKLQPHTGPILSFVKGWPLPQYAKRRLRPIFEPFINGSLNRDALPPLRYPSRLERRAKVAAANFQCEFDFAAYYDQIAFDDSVLAYYVIRVKLNGVDALFACTRLCMGVVPAVGIAQTATWSIVLPLLEFATTMIDNVRIAASTPAHFINAVRLFLARCDAAKVTINDREAWRIDDAAILQRGHCDRVGPFIFLGEEFRTNLVCNQAKHLENLRAAFALLREERTSTRRRFAALVGLVIFLAHTVDIGLWRCFAMLRAYARLVSPSSTEAGDVLWDALIPISASVVDSVGFVVEQLSANVPSLLRPLLPSGLSNADYDILILVDASAAGWAAFVGSAAGVFLISAGWNAEMPHSAHSEPRAALTALNWARDQYGGRNVAVVSDHRALATGLTDCIYPSVRWWHAAISRPLRTILFWGSPVQGDTGLQAAVRHVRYLGQSYEQMGKSSPSNWNAYNGINDLLLASSPGCPESRANLPPPSRCLSGGGHGPDARIERAFAPVIFKTFQGTVGAEPMDLSASLLPSRQEPEVVSRLQRALP
jgi:hypothetical protein